MRFLLPILISLFVFSACQNDTTNTAETESETTTAITDDAGNQNVTPSLIYPKESHFLDVKQLTFGGDNAEAYFSFNNYYLVFQASNSEWGADCDQIFYMPTAGTNGRKAPMISTGKGRTTCSFFMPGDSTIIYASTHAAMDTCPAVPRSISGKYVWPIYPEFDIYEANLKGETKRTLAPSPGYDAEATVSPDGKKIVFTSTRSGDLELYTMNIDGSNIQQVTNELGYDGGAFFMPDSKRLIFRASRPKTDEAIKTYKDLLAQNVVQPTDMELFICDLDGSNMKQITKLGGANWAPYPYPGNQDRIIFSSNHHTDSKRQFNLFAINTDGSALEQITYDDTFDSFPMFSRDGNFLVFSSNRNNGGTRDTNLFYARFDFNRVGPMKDMTD
ncbi:MAG: TolB family protein [Saprospiraceae bacterium]